MSQQKVSGKIFSNLELSAFCGQVALILKSGISSLEGIQIMLEDASSPEEKEILSALLENIQMTGSLYQAMEEVKLFPPYMLNMVQIGEETGTLDDVMDALSGHYEREDSIKRSIRGAVTYPLAMTGMMAVVVVILLVKVLPVFNQVFLQLGTEMSGFSRVLMDIGAVISRYAAVFIALLILAALLALYGTRAKAGRDMVRRLGYSLPFTKAICEGISAGRFANGMALTLSSGLNPERSMELVNALNEDPYFQKKLDNCQKQIDEGTDLNEALASSGIFTGMYARMTAIGTKTGTMDQVMAEISALYQNDIDVRINNLLAALEPTLVILLSLITGAILLSVMLPLMGIISSI